MRWLIDFIVSIIRALLKPPKRSPIPEPFTVPEIPITEGLPAGLPSVQTAVPPAEYFGSISAAIDKFTAATLREGDRGGLVAIATRAQDGSLNVNLAVVQKVGKKGEVVGWVGTRKSWGEPLGYEGGVAWRQRW